MGDPYFDLDLSRLRQFGGSSNHWEGWSRAFDAYDFEARDGVPHSGWPIRMSDLAPFDAATREILEVPQPRERRITEGLNEIEFGFSPVGSFAEKYGDFFAGSDLAHVVLKCPVLRLEAEDGRVSRVHYLDTGTGEERAFEPEIVVLATGGIENSRLLLWSNATSPQRVVADETALGRYWMEHPHWTLGEARFRGDVTQFAKGLSRFFVAPDHETMRRYGILNGALRLRRTFAPGDNPVEVMLKRGACNIKDLDPTLDALISQPELCSMEVDAATEQAPDPENRVELSAEARDDLGVPRPVLYWRKSEIDYLTPKVIYELFGRYLLDSGLGIARANDFTIEGRSDPDNPWPGGHHHMGGTRMSADPRNGIVDADLRIHGSANAYVAGSSVFPSGGHANPTFTIVQLSLRLGEHLAGRLK